MPFSDPASAQSGVWAPSPLDSLFALRAQESPLAVLWFVLQNVALLEEEADINQLTEFFSYEHFYVIYCKFWELDTDHDLLIDAQDLARHNDHGERSTHRAWGRGGARAPGLQRAARLPPAT